MNLRAQQLKNRLEELRNFINLGRDGSDLRLNDLMDWVTNCVVLFYELKLDTNVINGFIETFDSKKLSITNGGAFYQNDYNVFAYRYAYRGRMYFYEIAFRLANESINNIEEKSRLIPKWLIPELNNSGNSQLDTIAAVLEKLEESYQQKNATEITSSVITLLECILDLESTVKECSNNVSGKIEFLLNRENSSILRKFGEKNQVKQILKNLDSSRVIRNLKIDHPQNIKNSEVTLVSAALSATVIMVLLESVIVKGDLV
jgi:hypothetical protein